MKTKNTFIVIGLVIVIVLTITASAKAAKWTQKADMPTPRHGLSTCVVNGKIYAFGGQGGLKKVEEYDPVTDTWTQKADIPTGRYFLATSAVDGKIFAIGGYIGFGSTRTQIATVEEYDPATDTWTQKADMPGRRGGLGTCVVNGRIYAVGGSGSGGYIATVWEYNPVTDTWTMKADMPTRRNLAPTSLVNGKIYTFGGHTPNALPALSSVEEYDPITDTWTKKADMPEPRAWGATSVVDEKIFVFGGYTGKATAPLSTLFQYEPATDTWTALDDMPGRMAGLSTSVVDGRIYVIGGTSAGYPYTSGFLSTVWEYDTGLRSSSPDINGDGVVDGADFYIMVNHWHMDEPLCDIAPAPFRDGIVDVRDLVLLSEHLFEDLDDSTLAAHWALDESEGDIVFDSAGINDAFVIGDPLWQPDGGMVDGAIQLDGVDDYIVTGTVLNPANGPFSVLAWVNGGAAGQTIVSEPSGANWLSTDPLNGSLITELKASGRSGVPLLSETIITDGNWHRIGFVWDGSYRTLYVDSIVVAQDMQGGLEDSSKSLHIGTGNNMEIGTFWSGLIDDVRIYKRVVIP